MLAATSNNNSGGGGIGFIVIAVIAIVFVVLIRRTNQRRVGAAQATRSEAVIGSEVMTGGGLYGTVVGQDEEQVLLEIAPGVQVRFAKAAIARVISSDEPDDLPSVIDGEAAEDSAGDDDHPHEAPPEPPDDPANPPGDTAG